MTELQVNQQQGIAVIIVTVAAGAALLIDL